MIYVVDSIMGSGKTSAVINMMNEDAENNYIYITPYLSEIERIKKSCPDRKFYEPKVYQHEGETYYKLDSLHQLLKNNKNIATTHSLFKMATEETKELLYSGNYILVLDEVVEVVKELNIAPKDIEMLFQNEWLIYGDDNLVLWNNEKEATKGKYDGVFAYVKRLAQNKNLIIHNNTILLWNFPADIFRLFKDAYILTYLFPGTLQCYYYAINNIDYSKCIAVYKNGRHIIKQVENYSDKHIKDALKQKIHIYEGSLNKIGDEYYALSKSWYKDKKHLHGMLKNNVLNYFMNIIKSKSDLNMWTTFKDFEVKIKGKGYSKGFVECNARATNEHRHKQTLAYTINMFLNPIIEGYFISQSVKINEDMLAVSELLQWIWRSAIREQNEINLYIPSKRMRNILVKWLNDEI